jgi:hypothetical protein
MVYYSVINIQVTGLPLVRPLQSKTNPQGVNELLSGLKFARIKANAKK